MPLQDTRLLKSSRVISITDFDKSPLSTNNQSDFENVKDMILRVATLLWLSDGGLLKTRSTAALIQGLRTAVAVERPSAKFITVDLAIIQSVGR